MLREPEGLSGAPEGWSEPGGIRGTVLAAGRRGWATRELCDLGEGVGPHSCSLRGSNSNTSWAVNKQQGDVGEALHGPWVCPACGSSSSSFSGAVILAWVESGSCED